MRHPHRRLYIGVTTIIIAILVLVGFFSFRTISMKNTTTAHALENQNILSRQEFEQQLPDSPDTVHGNKTKSEWEEVLPELTFRVLHEDATETPFTSDLLDEKRPGTYFTADCGQPVFRSEDKFDSGTGWPSFTRPISDDALIFVEDYKLGVRRIEVRGSQCGTHLGHVFPDGPPEETGLRYCINGAALRFVPDE